MANDQRRRLKSEILPLRDEGPAAPPPPPQVEEAQVRHDHHSRKKSRRRALAPVGRGLPFHYVATGLLLAAGGAGLAGLGLFLVGALVGLFGGANEVARSFAGALGILATIAFFLGNTLILLGSVADLLCSCLCLRAPEAPARGLVVGAILLRAPLAGLLVWFTLLPQTRAIATVAVLAVQLLTWELWISFLHQTCARVGSEGLARDAAKLRVQAVYTALGAVAAAVLLAFFGSLLVMSVLEHWPWGVLTSAGVAGVVIVLRLILLGRDGYSLLEAALAPTGVPFVLRYLGFLAALRAEAG
jgi:hypothetical protein